MEIICDFFKCQKRDLIQKLSDDHSIKERFDFLKNLDFIDHLQQTVKIKDISSKNSLEHKFKPKNEQNEISVKEYFFIKHEIKLNYPELNLLMVEKNNFVNFIPIEVCNLKSGRRSNLNPNEQSNMVNIIYFK